MSALPGTGLGPHNTIVLILGESGIIPAAVFIVFLAYWLWEAFRCRVRPVRSLALCLWIVLVMRVMTAHGAVVDKNHALIIGVGLGLLAGARELTRRAAFGSAAMTAPRMVVLRPSGAP
jgi:hypothetical protein